MCEATFCYGGATICRICFGYGMHSLQVSRFLLLICCSEVLGRASFLHVEIKDMNLHQNLYVDSHFV